MLADTPVLLLAGGADERARPQESSAIAAALHGPHTLTVIDGADHLQLLATDQERYFAAVAEHLARCCARR